VSDPTAGSVFIYDPNLSLVGELKGLDKPLGIAVDQQGNMYVGNNGSDNVEVYDFNGVKIATIGQGRIRMANDLALDRSGNLYVADSLSNVVWVYDANGVALNNIGNGALEFPVAVTIAYRDDGTGREVGELYVAEQANFLVNVYDLQGNLLRFYGGQVRQGMMGWKWQGLFANIQSLAVDRYGRLHVADCYMNKVQILNADTGSYIGYYGEAGGAPGQLNLPLDIAINSLDQVAVTNFGNKRVEIIYTVP
jgi:DNA-binding beta-propeller fold protein YncE